ncbi:MAG: chromosome segregation protein SMC [Deltaproteobacteria bacterium]|nr:chromosome segregation protein SMC [Deltaproteobacteria bacterium]
MKIRKLEITGFKSFVDRTVLTFDHDITGVVGPNGCGKSNIVDAILWAMGEQSPKHLRGKAMDDVIFNGSESRGPGGFAEVTLTFDNSAGVCPPEYRECSEIAVTRRLARDGDSDYLINRTPVRLRDVTELFLGTGVGTKAYSIIEQGRIGLIVSSKPEDRRSIIEEAAGITKYKARKKAAERKMEMTQQNLLRVSDIVGEIEKNLSTLQRQAQKAERYKRYRAEIRDLELHVASHKYLGLVVEQKLVSSELTRLDGTLEGLRSAFAVRDAEAETRRAELSLVEREVDQKQRAAYELDNTVRALDGRRARDLERFGELRERETRAERELLEAGGLRTRLEAERAALAEQMGSLDAAEAEARLAAEARQALLDAARAALGDADGVAAKARSAVADAGSRIARADAMLGSFERRRQDAHAGLAKLENELNEATERASRLAEQLVSTTAQLAALRDGSAQRKEGRDRLEEEKARLRAELVESDRLIAELRPTLEKRRSRLHSLEEIRARFEGVGAGPRAIMRDPPAGVVGLVADRIEAPSELTAALAGALGERLQSIVVESLDVARAVVDTVAQRRAGRVTTVLRTPLEVARVERAEPPRDGGATPLLDLVRFDAEDAKLAEHLLAGVLVVADLAEAERRLAEGSGGWTFVTRAGELLSPDGTLVGGATEAVGTALLDTKREIRELRELVPTLNAELGERIAKHDELRRDMARVQGELEAARVADHQGELAVVSVGKDLRRAEEDKERTDRRVAKLADECEQLRRALADTGDEERAARDELELARRDQEGARVAALDAEQGVVAARHHLDEESQRAAELRVTAARAREQAASVRGSIARLDTSVKDVMQRDARLRAEVIESAMLQGEVAAQVMRAGEELAVATTDAMRAATELGEARKRFDAAREIADKEELGLRELRVRIDAVAKDANKHGLRERELSLALGHLIETVTERHRTAIQSVLLDYHARTLPDEGTHQRIDELLRLVERMGEINLTAITEFEEQSKRHAFLAAQKKDLEDALKQLEQAITKMNRESRRLFQEAFEAVNERFQRVFPQMFGGGRAHLVLTNPTDMLDTGIDIVAMPPGKRLGRIELMSGGEKALTAVSLIFAIFQYKPSPFCLLDEVDAPLDEANINRFCEAVHAMTDRSQFIVITHSKRTMEQADVLIGVTMEEPGVSKLVTVELKTRKRAAAPRPAGAVSEVAVA